MTDSITITVPMNYFAVTRAADMFHGIACDLQKGADLTAEVSASTGGLVEPSDDQKKAKIKSLLESGEGLDNPLVLLSEQTGKPIEELTQTVGDESKLAHTGVDDLEQHVGDGETTGPIDTTTSTVELDKDGLPWDARINSGNRTKLASGAWKLKRKPQDLPEDGWSQVVADVHAELRNVMDVPQQHNPVSVYPDASINKPDPIETAAETPPPPPEDETSAITTLPQFIAAATGAQKTQDEILAACKAHGITSVPLLGARPDLIPAIAATLGL